MLLGIKTGPQAASITDLETTQALYSEVWFDVNRLNEYTDLFRYFKSHNTEVGLHFWGVIEKNIWANIAYPDADINRTSMDLMVKCIDIASYNGHKYVNIHPGSASIVSVDLNKFNFKLLAKPVNPQKSTDNFLRNVTKLNDYAIKKNVVLTVETVPQRVGALSVNKNNNILFRETTINIHELNIAAIQQAALHGINIANDFGHTAANLISDDPDAVWNYLKNMTIKLAPYTKLIHLGFIIPPYNGTDFHDTLENPILETKNAIPNKLQMIELLKIFRDRKNVWIICEPQKNHIKNYELAKGLISQI
jgi:sugar phosphate isomerase/epimerase